MSSAWEQFSTAMQRIGEAFPHLRLAFFALGAVAALWLLRRNLLQTRYDGRRELACFRTRSLKAHADIDQISAREWFAQYHRARQFSRTSSALTAEQQCLLKTLSLVQRKAGHS